MDTNNLNFKFKIKMLDIEAVRQFIGLSDNEKSIEVETTIGSVKVPERNNIELGIEWINELRLLKNNTIKATISYPKYFSKNNSFEITKQAQIKEVQEELMGILENTFKARVDVKNSKHTRIDYPINITKIKDFREWRNVFVLIAKATSEENGTLYSGVDRKNKKLYTKGVLVPLGADLEVNFYNQRENIKRKTGEDIGEEVLRVETRLKKEYVIKKYLGTSEVKRVKLKNIKGVARDIIKSEILDKLVKELKEEKEFLERELKGFLKGMNRNDRDKLGRFVDRYQSLIFDYELVDKAISSLECRKETKAEYREQVKRALKKLEKISDLDIKYFNNISRVNYLFYKLLGKEYKEFDVRKLI